MVEADKYIFEYFILYELPLAGEIVESQADYLRFQYK